MTTNENIGVSFGNKGINMSVSFEKGVSAEVEFPQGANIDTTELAKEQTLTDGVNTLAGKIDNIQLPEIDTTKLASKDLERFWDVVPSDSEEIISEEDIHAAVEDIWQTTFN